MQLLKKIVVTIKINCIQLSIGYVVYSVRSDIYHLLHKRSSAAISRLRGLSIGRPSILSHTNWVREPIALEQPNITVKNSVS